MTLSQPIVRKRILRKAAATAAGAIALTLGLGAGPAFGQSGYNPSPSTEVQGAVETRGQSQSGSLSFTGAESTETAVLGLSAVVIGVALVLGARRELRRR